MSALSSAVVAHARGQARIHDGLGRVLSARAGVLRLRACVRPLTVVALIVSGLVQPAIATSAPVVPDGPVHAITVAGRAVYVGGGFSGLGAPIGAGVVVDGTGGLLLSHGFPYGAVTAVTPDATTGWFVGLQTTVHGVDWFGIRHVFASGALDPLYTITTNGPVQALALSGTTLVAGGSFTRIGGVTHPYLAAFDALTGTVSAPTPTVDAAPPNTAGVIPDVTSLIADNGRVFVAGDFSLANGMPRLGLLSFTTTTGTLDAWNPYQGRSLDQDGCLDPLFSWSPPGGADAAQCPIAISGGFVYQVGRVFPPGTTGGSWGVVRYDEVTGAQSSWHPAVSVGSHGSLPTAVAVDANAAYVATGDGIEAFDLVAASPLWIEPVDGFVQTLASAPGGGVYAIGSFRHVAGQARFGGGALDATGALLPWAPVISGDLLAGSIAASGANVLIGGWFSVSASVARPSVAALRGAGRFRPTFARPLTAANTPGAALEPYSLVTSMAYASQRLYIAGPFAVAAYRHRYNGLIAVDARTGGLIPGFAPKLNCGPPQLVVSTPPTIWAANFQNGCPGVVLAQFAANGRLLRAFKADPQGKQSIWAMTATRRQLIVGGTFARIGKQARESLASIDLRSGRVTSWHPRLPSLFGVVTAIAVGPDGSIYAAGGQGTTIGLDRSVARFNAAGVLTDTQFARFIAAQSDQIPASLPVGLGVNALMVSGQVLYAGGAFTSVDGQPRPGLAAIDTTTRQLLAWQSPLTGSIEPLATGTWGRAFDVDALATLGKTVYAGGYFLPSDTGAALPFFQALPAAHR